MDTMMSVVTDKTPIEIALGIDEQGMTTARALYEFLELGAGQFARWAKANIENNEFYEENEDWWGFDIVSNGNKCKDYHLTTDFAKHLSMESHSAKGKVARRYFVTVEDKMKRTIIDRRKLSDRTRLIVELADSLARTEIEQKRLAEEQKRIAEKTEHLEQNQRTLTETFVRPSDIDDFKRWCRACITKIAESEKFTKGENRNQCYTYATTESYQRLKNKWNCNLDDRVSRAKGRASCWGATKAEINSITKLSIIAEDKSLRPIYETVLKEMMIAYCVVVA